MYRFVTFYIYYVIVVILFFMFCFTDTLPDIPLRRGKVMLPLNVDFIIENETVVNPLFHSQKSLYSQISIRFVYILMECWIKAVYYYVNSKTLY